RAIQQSFDSLQKQRYEKALEEIEPVLKEDPEMVDAHFVAGVACIGLGRFDPAIEELLRTLSFRPDDTMALYNLAYTYELKGDLAEAEKWYQKVLRNEPKHLFATLKLAHIYREWNQPGRAREYFLSAVAPYERALASTRAEKARAALHSTLGEIYFGAGDLSNAERNFRAAIQLTPDRDTLHFDLAQIFEARDQIPEAVEAYRQEIGVDPRSFKAYNNLGLLYQNTNRLEDAALCFRKVIELDEKNPRGYLLLSGVYRKMGRERDAAKVLRMAQQQGIPVD
ncbi:MAG TPA: tetratricopeptide repeat protein, partial [Acidobacteriota bacterium]|nr:tetratricopeptide repeat protein [Acidobacteriota bacterium]